MSARYKEVIACLVLSLYLQGCGDSSDEVKKEKPEPEIERPSPEKPKTESNNAVLSWSAPLLRMDGSSLKMGELNHYEIVYGLNSRPEEMTHSVVIDNASEKSEMRYRINDLSPGEWFFAIKTVDQNGLESPLSEVVSKNID